MGEMGKSTVIFGAWEFKMSNRYLSQLGQRPRQAPMCKSLRGPVIRMGTVRPIKATHYYT